MSNITLDYDPDTRTLSAGVPRIQADQTEAENAILQFLAKTEETVEETSFTKPWKRVGQSS